MWRPGTELRSGTAEVTRNHSREIRFNNLFFPKSKNEKIVSVAPRELSITILRLIKAQQKTAIEHYTLSLVFSSLIVRQLNETQKSKFGYDKLGRLGEFPSLRIITFSIFWSIMFTGRICVAISIWVLQWCIRLIASEWNVALETILSWSRQASVRVTKQAIVWGVGSSAAAVTYSRRRETSEKVSLVPARTNCASTNVGLVVFWFVSVSFQIRKLLVLG